MKKRTDNFSRFSRQTKGSVIKEAYRQEKRKNKAAARAEGEAFRKKKEEKAQGIPFRPAADKAPRPYAKRPNRADGPTRPGADKSPRPYTKRPNGPDGPAHTAGDKAPRPYTKRPNGPDGPARAAGDKAPRPYTKRPNGPDGPAHAAAKRAAPRATSQAPTSHRPGKEMPLNKFVAHCGICGRREAALLIKQGKISVDGLIINEPGYKVSGKEKIKHEGKPLQLQVEPVYILLNKPKDYLTTTNDPAGRKTVLELLKNATKERIYPVGRLDRNTTGVLLLTNDGELAQQLTHPSFEVKKIYEAILDKPMVAKDLEELLSGMQLEDGFIRADAAGYSEQADKTRIGIEIHSGKNRIVRRMFEHLGYEVKSLDRVMFANLTKKNVDRGKWRFLQEKEVRNLKFMNQSFIRKTASGKNTLPAR
jgi:23S rRNA pseudouridine2605 synthase